MTDAFDFSILETVKKGIGAINIDFHDDQLINEINSAFATLHQLGVGPREDAYAISDETNTWDEFLTSNSMSPIISYVIDKVSLGFDPPQNSNLIEVKKQRIAEFEFRLNVEFDTTDNGL